MLGCVGAVLGCRGTHWRDGGTLRYGDAVVCWGGQHGGQGTLGCG